MTRSTIFVPNNSAERIAPVALATLVLVFCLRSILTYRVFNDTADEAVHIACGLEMLERGRYTEEAQHPPLARVLLALPAHVAGLWFRKPAELWAGADREFYWRTLAIARAGNLVWVPLLILYVYLWARRLHGTIGGLAAATLVSFSPNLLAHASLATLDFAAATTTFIAAYHLWRCSEERSQWSWLRTAFAVAVAVLVKFSALLVLPVIGILFFLMCCPIRGFTTVPSRSRLGSGIPEPRASASGMTDRRLVCGAAPPGRSRPPGRLSGLLFLATVALLIWAGYLFDVGSLGPPQFHPPGGSFGQRLEHAAQRLADAHRLPAPQLFRGVLDVTGHNSEGHQCYLLGQLGQYGWWYYFPVALAVKTTLPFLVLIALWIADRRLWSRALDPVLAAAVALAVAMTSNINLGIRHVLVVYPLFAVIVSGLFTLSARRALRASAIVLLLWHVGESLAAHPDYLTYFNETARGREDKFLLDSALDWGQDLERLRRYLEEHKINSIYLSYFGRADPGVVGLQGVRRLPADLRPRGWVAVSKAHIAGLGLQGYNLGWLKAHKPVARIGKSILVYDLRE